jgi:hypothetical protein
LVVGHFWSGAAAARDLNLAPSSKWVMHYSPDQCTLARSFGQGEDTVIAQFVKQEPTGGFQLNLKGKPLAAWRRVPILSVRFGENGDFVSSQPIIILPVKPEESLAIRLSGRFDNFDFSRRSYSSLSRAEKSRLRFIDPAAEASVALVTIRGGGLAINLQTSSMRAPAAALKKCATELVTSWGLDPKQMEDLALLPEPKRPGRPWLSDLGDRYLRYKGQADLDYRLKINEQGVPTECTIGAAVGVKSVADAFCGAIMRNARFWPAETKDGTHVPSYYIGGVLYMW